MRCKAGERATVGGYSTDNHTISIIQHFHVFVKCFFPDSMFFSMLLRLFFLFSLLPFRIHKSVLILCKTPKLQKTLDNIPDLWYSI